MTALGFWEVFVLLAFWLGGLAAYLIGGFWALGYVVQALLVTVMCWVLRVLYLEFKDELYREYDRHQAFSEWKRRQQSQQLKGMD